MRVLNRMRDVGRPARRLGKYCLNCGPASAIALVYFAPKQYKKIVAFEILVITKKLVLQKHLKHRLFRLYIVLVPYTVTYTQ